METNFDPRFIECVTNIFAAAALSTVLALLLCRRLRARFHKELEYIERAIHILLLMLIGIVGLATGPESTVSFPGPAPTPASAFKIEHFVTEKSPRLQLPPEISLISAGTAFNSLKRVEAFPLGSNDFLELFRR